MNLMGMLNTRERAETGGRASVKVAWTSPTHGISVLHYLDKIYLVTFVRLGSAARGQINDAGRQTEYVYPHLSRAAAKPVIVCTGDFARFSPNML